MLTQTDAFTASNIPPMPDLPGPKLPKEIQEVVDNAQEGSLVLVYVKKLVCHQDTAEETEIKQKIEEHPKQFYFYTICYRPHELQFPEPATNIVYIFEPKAKWFSMIAEARGLPKHFNQVIETMEQRQGEQIRSNQITPEQEQNQIEMLQKENLEQFPSTFQQTRVLLKTGWDVAKGLAHGRALLVNAEVAYARLKTCEGCEHYKEKRCVKCGCWMEQKANLQAASCPVGKW